MSCVFSMFMNHVYYLSCEQSVSFDLNFFWVVDRFPLGVFRSFLCISKSRHLSMIFVFWLSIRWILFFMQTSPFFSAAKFNVFKWILGCFFFCHAIFSLFLVILYGFIFGFKPSDPSGAYANVRHVVWIWLNFFFQFACQLAQHCLWVIIFLSLM